MADWDWYKAKLDCCVQDGARHIPRDTVVDVWDCPEDTRGHHDLEMECYVHGSDDEVAFYVEKQNLCPWMGDDSYLKSHASIGRMVIGREKPVTQRIEVEGHGSTEAEGIEVTMHDPGPPPCPICEKGGE